MPPTNVLHITNLVLDARAAQARPPGPAGGSSLFGGLQTPPATPDADLDHRLEKLAVSSSGNPQQHQQPTTTTATSPLPSPASTPPAVEPPQQQQWPPITAVVASSSSSSPSSCSSSPPAAAELETAAAPGVVPVEEEGDPAFGNVGVVGPQAHHGGGAGFRLFPLLPAELRIRVWELSFEPRVVELHTRRLHYADDFRHGGHIYWHSQCANPAALSVSLEAREVALARYSVAVPLAVAPQGRGREVAGDSVADLHHRLYLDPASDTVALLGELDLSLLRSLFEVVRQADPTGRGVRRLGVSAACFKHQGLLSMYAKTVFRDIDELVLFMYVWRMPPERWSQGLCALEDCADKDFFRRWEMTVGKHFKTPDGQWLKVGKANKEIRIMDLLFLPRGYL